VIARWRRRINSPRDAHKVPPNKIGAFARELTERELDACSRAVYGLSHVDFCDILFTYAFTRGLEQGERKGRTAGRRAAKGLKTSAKKRGRPSEINEGERTLLIHAVEARKPGQTIKEAVTYFLRALQKGKRYVADRSISFKRDDHPLQEAITPAAVKKALWAYYRHSLRKWPS
jgi:hypothetical protein